MLVVRFSANLDIIARENVACGAIKYKYLGFYEGMNIGVSLLCRTKDRMACENHEQPFSCVDNRSYRFSYTDPCIYDATILWYALTEGWPWTLSERENIFFWLFLHLSRRLLRRKVHVWWFEVKEKEREKCKLREYCRWDKSKNRVKVQRSQLYSKRERDIFDTYQPITKNIVSISDNCEYLQSKEWVMKIES